ncbi:MAG: spore maturation protein A [Oscillospiraceae bacterium]|nr:spore maturation protein A [Oscillospiraceae bacterium]
MAMTWIWVGMLALSLFCGLLTGSGDLGRAAMEGAGKAVSLCVSLTGSLCLWSGFAAVLERSGLQAGLARLLSPLLGRLYPTARRDEATMGALCGNVTANLLGLGSAATPLGVEAVRRMQALAGTDAATDEMCRLVVMNTASIQILPTTVAALRGSLGAAKPFDILPAVWVTSVLSVSAGLIAAGFLRHFWAGHPVKR